MARSVLITGAGSGIGLATALLLAARGFRVYASVPAPEQQAVIAASAVKHGVSLQSLLLDVTDKGSIAAAVEDIVFDSGSLYAVVHSAGLGLRGFFEDISEEEIRRLFDVNVFGVMAVTRAALPVFRAARRGRLVILSSAAGRIATMSLSAYAAGKFALEGFAESLSMEVASFGIGVSLIEPGLVLTPHFTVHRGRAQGATDPASPYYTHFVRHERMVDERLRAQPILPADVAAVIHRALTARRPRLRYPVGRGPKIMFWLRRFLPASIFERLYFGAILRRMRDLPADSLGELTLPGEGATDYLGLSVESGS